jgi:hypothetical protein
VREESSSIRHNVYGKLPLIIGTPPMVRASGCC